MYLTQKHISRRLVVFFASGLCFWLIGEGGFRQRLIGRSQRAVLLVLIGLIVIMAAGYFVYHLFNGPGVTLADRIAAFLLFAYGVAYLAFVNYLIGLLIRHLLRAEAVGGPLADINGRVIGVNNAIYSQSGGNVGIGFAIPINQARDIAEQLIKTGKITRGYLGVQIATLEDESAVEFGYKPGTKGVLVSSVDKGTPGERAGLHVHA